MSIQGACGVLRDVGHSQLSKSPEMDFVSLCYWVNLGCRHFILFVELLLGVLNSCLFVLLFGEGWLQGRGQGSCVLRKCGAYEPLLPQARLFTEARWRGLSRKCCLYDPCSPMLRLCPLPPAATLRGVSRSQCPDSDGDPLGCEASRMGGAFSKSQGILGCQTGFFL